MNRCELELPVFLGIALHRVSSIFIKPSCPFFCLLEHGDCLEPLPHASHAKYAITISHHMQHLVIVLVEYLVDPCGAFEIRQIGQV